MKVWEGCVKMGLGIEAVKKQIVKDFGHVDFHEQPIHGDSSDTALYFDADGMHYRILVSLEFDADFASIQPNLGKLAQLLRESPNGRVRVHRGGVFPDRGEHGGTT